MSDVLRKAGDVVGGRVSWLITIALVLIMAGEPVQRWALLAYHKAYPVITDWSPDFVAVDGSDVIVSGSMNKSYDCAYVPPPRAFSPSGKPLIVRSMSSTPTANYPTGNRPFGPWRIVDGAVSPRIDLEQEHDCGSDALVFSKLGSLKRPYSLEKR